MKKFQGSSVPRPRMKKATPTRQPLLMDREEVESVRPTHAHVEVGGGRLTGPREAWSGPPS